MKYIVKDISWDADDNRDLEFLPKELAVDVDDNLQEIFDESELVELLSDAITNETGFCHNGFDYEKCDDFQTPYFIKA